MGCIKPVTRLLATVLIFFAAATAVLPCVPGGDQVQDRFVTLLLEDHGGMREMVWDSAFQDLTVKGPFQASHRYVLQTTSRPALIDFGCWDGNWGGDWSCQSHNDCGDRRGPCGHGDGGSHSRNCLPNPSVPSCDWVSGRAGVILGYGGKTTWLPVAAPYDGYELPTATFRGAYLNWLLQNRGATPSIPAETRWQRLQRGAGALAQDLLGTAHGDPHMLLVAVGTSGRLLIPPTESSFFAGICARAMTPDLDGASLYGAMQGALDMVQGMRPPKACLPGLFILMSDGWSLNEACGSATPYESLSSYAAVQRTVAAIPATGQAALWTWNVEGPGTWAQALANAGDGSAFAGDTVPALETAVKGWMSGRGQPLRLALSFSQAALTRQSQVTATLTANHPLASATLNGKVMVLNGASASLQVTLKEGQNAFTAQASDICRGQASATGSLTLDTTPPRITLTSPANGLVTNALALVASGVVDDPTATVTVNGIPTPLNGPAFSAILAPPPGIFTVTVTATDPVGNSSTVSSSVLVDRTAPVITVTSSIPQLTNLPALILQGTVSEPSATLSLNGQTVPLDAAGHFTVSAPLPVEGINAFHFTAVDKAGNLGVLSPDPFTTRDTVPPVLAITAPREGFQTNASSLTVTGTVNEASNVLLNSQLMTLVQVPDGTFTFSTTLAPAEGPLTLTAQATDLAGNTTTLTRHGVIDRTSPVITVTSPLPVLTNLLAVNVAGTVNKPAASLTVNGQPVALDGAGAFTCLPLLSVEGINPIHFQATDPAGNVGTLDLYVTRDTVPPTVAITSPQPGLLTNAATLLVTGTVSDSATQVTVNGQTVQVSGGAFTTTLAPPPGPLTITATAQDAAGNVGTASINVTIDRSAPVITLTQAPPALTRALSVPVAGTVNKPVASLTVNGAAVSLSGQTFTASVPLTQEGANPITFTATDLAGNTGTLTVQSTRKTTPPVVKITSPMDGFTTNLAGVPITGTVDDPTATVTLQGGTAAVDSQGNFTGTVAAPKEGRVAVTAQATDTVGNVGSSVVYVKFDFTPPVLAWIDPTPAQGAQLTQAAFTAAVAVNEAALTSINGQRVELQPGDSPAQPFKALATLSAQEGQLVLTATAVDGAGNRSTLTRTLAVGLTTPTLTVTSPVFDATGAYSTANVGVTLTGQVLAPAFVQPLTLTLNGAPAVLAADGSFTLPLSLTVGSNPVVLVATSAFGQSVTRTLTVLRTGGVLPPGSAPGITIDWPQQGFAATGPSMAVKGHVTVPGMTATLNGASVTVDPQALTFNGTVTLTAGANVITAQGTDAQGRTAAAAVTGTYVLAGAATYTWLTPASGAHAATRTQSITGTATQPGIVSITVNGAPMTLTPATGTFAGSVTLQAPGPNALVLTATALDGTTQQETRTVSFEPALPQVVLNAPATARPGDQISIQVTPGTGTSLVKADLTWNGLFLATVTAPWSPVTAQVPADAVVGSTLPISVLATDDQGAAVTARSYVTIYGAGALLVQAYDDSQGLPFTDQTATATVDGGAPQALDATGRAALPTALPQNWVLLQKPGFTKVWRSAALTVGAVQAVVSARLTPLAPGQNADGAGFTGTFGGGALQLSLPGGALGTATSLSVTPLTTHGLPGLLPAGWSPVSAWWLDLAGQPLTLPATANLNLASTLAPPSQLPAGATFAWARWDPTQHAWTVLAAPLSVNALTSLPLPQEGGYALLLADPGATAPPAPVTGAVLPGFEGTAWVAGLATSGGITPALLPTVDAINGARAVANFALTFGPAPIPSATLIQTDVLESYTLVDQSVIEPDGFTQDVVAAQWTLEAVNGTPVLTPVTNGLGLRLPVRMSRTFDPAQLVEGRILVGFYHDGTQLANSGSDLIGAAGGTVSQNGVNVTLAPGAVTGNTLLRITTDGGDLAALWPEAAGQGAIVRSFTVDVVGTLASGMAITLDALSVPAGVRPLLVERRTVQGQRLLVAVGELVSQGSGWTLNPATPVLTPGAFAVITPASPWDWIAGTATLPTASAQAIQAKVGAKAKLAQVSRAAAAAMATRGLLTGAADPGMAVGDVSVDAGYILAVSGADGTFAVPALLPTDGSPISVTGTRWDLGITGSLTAPVPSQGNLLTLSTTPFRIETLLPDPASPIPQGTVFQVVTSTPADPASLGAVTLQEASLAADGSTLLTVVPTTPSLSQDGRTLLLTPAAPLDLGATYHLILKGYQSLTGDTAPPADMTYTVAAVPQTSTLVDFTRIQLTYPDASFNITVTIPAGAVPPGAAIEVEAPQMGSVGTGTMLPTGDLTFVLKANLGERLQVRVQLQTGQVFQGYVSRYAATDGSGKVTVSVDGGRIDANDGSGAAVTLPAGTLDHAVEFQCQFAQDPPADLLPSIQDAIPVMGRVQLLAREAVKFYQVPVLEFPAPTGALNYGGNVGAYAICFRNDGFETDGTPARWYEFLDTADAGSDGKLHGKGGLPGINMPGQVALQTTMPTPSMATQASRKALNLNARKFTAADSAADGPGSTPCDSVGLSAMPDQTYWGGVDGAYPAGTPWPTGFTAQFYVELDGVAVANPGKVVVQGMAVRNLPGQTPGAPVFMAPIYFAPTTSAGTTPTKNGQYLTRTNECGHYLLMDSVYPVLTDKGAIIGVDPDYGIRASQNLPVTPTTKGRNSGQEFFDMTGQPLTFTIPTTNLANQTPPYVFLNFAGPGLLDSTTAQAGPIDVVVTASSMVDKSNLTVEVRVDDIQAALCSMIVIGGAPSSAYSYKQSGAMGIWTVHLNLPSGTHRILALVTDQSKNTSQLEQDIQVLDYTGVNQIRFDPAKPPTFSLVVSGGLDAAAPDSIVQIVFSQPVQNVSATTLQLQVLQDSSTWANVADTKFQLGTNTQGQVTMAWIQPSCLLTLGAQYQVIADPSITDYNPPAAGGPRNLASATAQFTVQAHSLWGSVDIPGASKIAAIGNSLFVSDLNNKIHMLLTTSAGVIDQGSFGDFQGQGVDALAAFAGVQVPGAPYPGLLLVTTSPNNAAAYGQNCVLWGFSFCSAQNTVQPLFNVSLGQTATGYSPGVDYLAGVIAVARLSGSIALIDLQNAISYGAPNPAQVVDPVGAGGVAIFQPFYVSDPAYEYTLNGAATISGGNNYGIALVAPLDGSTAIQGVVAYYGDLAAQWRGLPIVGMPQFKLPYVPNAGYSPLAPFIPDPGSEKIAAPPASEFVTSGVVEKIVGAQNYAPTCIVSWPNATVSAGGQIRNTTLVIGTVPGPSGNTLVAMDVSAPDADANNSLYSRASRMWFWPQSSPFGTGVPYTVVYRRLSMDPATGLCAVEVQNARSGDYTWFILDLTSLDNIQVVDAFPVPHGQEWHGDLSYGVFSVATGTSVLSWQVLNLNGAILPTNSQSAASLKQNLKKGGKESTSVSDATLAPKLSAGGDSIVSQKTRIVSGNVAASAATLASVAKRNSVAARVMAALGNPALPTKTACDGLPKSTATIYAVSINQGVEKIFADTVASDAAELLQDVSLSHKAKVPVVANRPGQVHVWLKNPGKKATLAQVTLTMGGASGSNPTQSVNVIPGNPDPYGFTSGGGLATFDLTSAQIKGTSLSFSVAIGNSQDGASASKSLTAKLTQAAQTVVYIHPLHVNWGDSDSFVSDANMTLLATTYRDRIRAYFPLGMGDQDVQVIRTPGDFQQFKWGQNEGTLYGKDSQNRLRISSLLNKWSIHVRRYLVNHPPSSSIREFFVLVVNLDPNYAVDPKSSSFAAGISWVPNSDDSTSLTPALIGDFTFGSKFTTGATMESMVDGIFIHELGHAHGRNHVQTTAEYARPDPNSLDADWPGFPNQASDTHNDKPGVHRYGNARVGVPGWDYVKKTSIPFGSGKKKYTVMAYTKDPWVSDFDWSTWIGVNQGSQINPSGEQDVLIIDPRTKLLCPSQATLQFNSLVDFGPPLPAGASSNTPPAPINASYQIPGSWSLREPSRGQIGTLTGLYTPPSIRDGANETILVVPVNELSYKTVTLTLGFGLPSIQPDSCKLFIKLENTPSNLAYLQSHTFQWAWDQTGTDMGDADDTFWQINFTGSSNGFDQNSLTPYTGALTVFTAPTIPGSYQIGAGNPRFTCSPSSTSITANIEVRQVLIKLPDPMLLALSPGQSWTISATASGGYKEPSPLSWSVVSGPGTVDENGMVTAGQLPVGQNVAILTVRVTSVEDPRVIQDVNFFVTP